MKKLQRIICVLVTLIIISMSSVAVAVTEEEVKDRQNDLASIEEDIKNSQQKVEELKKQKASVMQSLEGVLKELNHIKEEESKLYQELDELELNIEDTTQRLEKQEQEAEKQAEEMKDRLTIMYMNGKSSYLVMLFEAKSMNDLLKRLELVKCVANYDNDILAEMKAIRDEIAESKQQLESMKAEKETVLQAVLENKKATEAKQQEYEKLSQEIGNMQAAEESNLEQLEKDSKALEAEIKRLQEELRYAEKYSGGIMAWPVNGFYNVTSPFGYRIHPIYGTKKMHTGIDIGSNWANGQKISIYGQKIVAGAEGRVILSKYYGGYGQCIIIDHGGKITSLYAHASKRLVSQGQIVKRGQTIAYVGSTGASTGPHLHFEVRENGTPVNPVNYLK